MATIFNVECPSCGSVFPRSLDAETPEALAVARAELEEECPDHDDGSSIWDEGEDAGGWNVDDWTEETDADGRVEAPPDDPVHDAARARVSRGGAVAEHGV